MVEAESGSFKVGDPGIAAEIVSRELGIENLDLASLETKPALVEEHTTKN